MHYLISNLLSTKEGPTENPVLWGILIICLSWVCAAFVDALLPGSRAKKHAPPPPLPLPECETPECYTPPGYRTPVPVCPPHLLNPWDQRNGPDRNLNHLAPYIAQGGLYAGCDPQVLDQYLTQEAARIKARMRTAAYRQESEVMDIVGIDVWRQAVELVVYQRHCNGPDTASNRVAIEVDLETTPVFEKDDIQNLHANHRHMCHCSRMCTSLGWSDSETSVRFFYDLWLLRFRFQYDTVQKFASRPPLVALEVYKMRLVKHWVFGDGINRGEVCWWYPRYIWTNPDKPGPLTPNNPVRPHSNLNPSTAIASHWFQDWINEKDNLEESIVFPPDSILGFKLGCHFFASVKISKDHAPDVVQRGWHGFLKELDSESIDSVVEKYGISVCQEWDRDLAIVRDLDS